MNLSDFLSTSVLTRVAILDNDTLQPIFESAHPMRVSANPVKRATKFAVEDGTERSDHVVKELVEIQIDFTAVDDVRAAYESLYQVWDQNTLVTVQTKVRSFPNMLLLGVPHEESVELGTAISMPLRFQEWIEVKPEEGELPPKKVANKNQSSTVKRGQVKGVEADESTKRKGSVLSGIFS